MLYLGAFTDILILTYTKGKKIMIYKTYLGKIKELPPNHIFVFGSNTQGRHGAGSALFALQKCGAIYGQARGKQGQSYAIVTKDLTKRKHPSIQRSHILEQIVELFMYAWASPHLTFMVAYSGTGVNLNGYTPQEMASMFAEANSIKHPMPDNIMFEFNFFQLIKNYRRK